MMLLVIKFLGSFLLLVGVVAVIYPIEVKKRLTFFFEDQWLSIISGVRILLGFFLITVAPMSRYPTLLLIAGVVVVVLGFSVLLLSHKQIIKTELWWLERNQNQIRILSLIPIGIGSFLYFAGS